MPNGFGTPRNKYRLTVRNYNGVIGDYSFPAKNRTAAQDVADRILLLLATPSYDLWFSNVSEVLGEDSAIAIQELGNALQELKDAEVPDPDPEFVRLMAAMMAAPVSRKAKREDVLFWFEKIKQEIRCHHFYSMLREDRRGGAKVRNYSNYVDLSESPEWEVVA